ncbi:MAG: ATP-binding protein [Candidatus Omnitrophica bacterium]|nr:ATP-binding protein [Candidatus Omnitrophota bacterium]
MNKNELRLLLEDWNFWTKEQRTGISRERYLAKLNSLVQTNFVVAVTGSRRSGKSFIMRQMAKKLIADGLEPKNILFVNFEDPSFPARKDAAFLDEIFDAFYQYIAPDKQPTIFFDEIHEVAGFEKWIRKAHELQKARMIISGSNAHLLSPDLATIMTGRHLDVTVFPLSFREFLRFQGVEIKNSAEAFLNKPELNKWLYQYLEFGAFPEVVLKNEKKEILYRYFEDIITHDLLQRYKISKIQELRALVRFYMSNISSLITFKSITRSMKLSINSVGNYSGYLEEAYLLFLVKRFDYKTKEQEKSPRKVYAIDTGLCNVIGFRFSENLGKLAENAVFLSLKRRQAGDFGMEIYYWKDEAHREVDFVIKNGLKVNELIQVCWNVDDEKTKAREIRSLLKAMREFKLNKAIVVTGEYEASETLEGKSIEYIPLGKWLLLNEDLDAGRIDNSLPL